MTDRHKGSGIDDFLYDEGVLEEFQTRAVKEVIAWQIAEAMKTQGISKPQLAGMMRTSRTQIDRLLDPGQGNVTIETLRWAAEVVGRKLRIGLV